VVVDIAVIAIIGRRFRIIIGVVTAASKNSGDKDKKDNENI
jgi:hypothetical protein